MHWPRPGLPPGLGAVGRKAVAAPKHDFKLLYAPHLSLMGHIEDPIDRLDAYADFGFKAFEFNGLMGWDYARAEKLRARMDKLNMTMGVFVANPDGLGQGRDGQSRAAPAVPGAGEKGCHLPQDSRQRRSPP